MTKHLIKVFVLAAAVCSTMPALAGSEKKEPPKPTAGEIKAATEAYYIRSINEQWGKSADKIREKTYRPEFKLNYCTEPKERRTACSLRTRPTKTGTMINSAYFRHDGTAWRWDGYGPVMPETPAS